jgi:hypothetical protein
MWHIWGSGAVYTGFWWGNLRKRDLVEGLGCKWKGNIKIDFKKIGWEGVEWINVAHDVDKWQAVVNTVMNFWA